MPDLDDINAKLTLDTVGFTGPLAEAEEKSTASQRAIAREAKKAADAQAFASKFASDAVTKESLKIIEARKQEAAASADYRKAQSLLRNGYVGEGEGATLAAAALQRLTKAKLESAAASKIQSKEEERVSLRFHEGGVGLGGTIAESAGGMAALAAAAVASEAMKSAIETSVEFGETIKQAGEKTGLTVGTLTTLHYAAAITGTDFDRMTAAASKMDKTIAAATEGNKPAADLMKALGLNATELAGRSDGAQIAFETLTKKIAATENPIRRVELASAAFGQRSGAEMVPMLVQLGNNWDAFREKSAAAGMQLSEKTIDQLAATSQQLKDLQQHVQGAGLSFTTGFVPAFSAMLTVMMSGKSSADAFAEWGRTMGRIIAGVAEAAYSAAAGVESLFALAEGYKLTAAGRRDGAAVDQLMQQAHKFHDIAFGDKLPDPKPIAPTAEGGTGGAFNGTNSGQAAALAAAKKAQAERLKQMEAALNAEKLIHSVSLKEAFNYWEQMKATFKAGSDGYNAIVAKQAEIAASGAAKAHELILKSIEAAKHQPNAPTDPTAPINAMNAAGRRDQTQAYIDSNQLAIDEAHNKMLEQTAILAESAGRSMTRYAAAVQLAQQHEAEYQTIHASLESILAARIDADKTEHTRESGRAVTAAQIAIANSETDHRIQQMKDRDALGQNDPALLDGMMVGVKDSLQQFILANQNAAKAMSDIVTHTLDDVNQQLVNGMTGDKMDWGSVGKGIEKDTASSALKYGESSLMKGLFGQSMGKPDGTANNPIYTMDASKAAKNGIGGLIGKLFKSHNDDSDDGDSDGSGAGAGKSILGAIGSFFGSLGHHANGGTINGPSWVGEAGPEIWMPPTPGGQIIPNYAIGQGGGSSPQTNINYQIDAKGTDPVQTEVRVRSAIVASHHVTLQQAEKQVRERELRKPGRPR